MSKKNFFLLCAVQLALLTGLSYSGFFKSLNSPLESSNLLFSKEHLNSLKEVSINYSDNSSPEKEVRLKKSKKGPWLLVNKKEVAEEKAVGKFIAALSSLTSLNTFSLDSASSKDELKEFGFEKSYFSVKLINPDLSYELTLGEKSQISSRRYVKIKTIPPSKDNSLIYVIDEGLVPSIKKTSFDFRNHTPLNFEPQSIQKIVFKKGIKKHQLTKKEEDSDWKFTSSESEFFVSESFVQAKLNSFRELRAINIIDSKTKEFEYFPEVLKVFLYDSLAKNSKPIKEIYFGESVLLEKNPKPDPLSRVPRYRKKNKIEEPRYKKNYYFRLDKNFPVYLTNLSAYKEFLNPEELLRDKIPLQKITSQLKSIEISGSSFKNQQAQSLNFSKEEILEAENPTKTISSKLGVLLSLNKMKVVTYLKEDDAEALGVFNKEPELVFNFKYIEGANPAQKTQKLAIYENLSQNSSDKDPSSQLSPSYALIYQSNTDKFLAAILSAGEKQRLIKFIKMLNSPLKK